MSHCEPVFAFLARFYEGFMVIQSQGLVVDGGFVLWFGDSLLIGFSVGVDYRTNHATDQS